jgi:prevent-host-death family protein
MAVINVYDARAKLSRLIDRAVAGEEIVIARNGRPLVRLTPVGETLPARKPGALKGLFEVPDSFFEPLPDDVLDAVEGGGTGSRTE